MNKKDNHPRQSAYTLLEIMIVISIIAFAYTVALPNLGSSSQTDIANSLNRFGLNIRTAIDTTILSGRPHRLVFELVSGKYWLETPESDVAEWNLGKQVREDPTEFEEKDQQERFKEKFEMYSEFLPEEQRDPKTDKIISSTSPVIKAKEKLSPTVWRMIKNSEWGVKKLHEDLIISSIKAEHHLEKISIEDNSSEKLRAFVYIRADGNIEETIILYFNRNPKGSRLLIRTC